MFKHVLALNTYTEPFLSLKANDQRAIIEQLLGITMLSEKAEALKEQNKNGKETKILTIVSHTMLLIGIIQWFAGAWGLKLIQNVGMGALMKNAEQRLMAVEHPLTMIIAIALITVGGVSVKKGKSNAKWFYILALVLILSRIPWARALFPGM
jgi:hypothetical protein